MPVTDHFSIFDIEATAPGRCGIVGNPSDMYGGSVLSCTVVERATCRLGAGEAGVRVSNAGETMQLHNVADLRLCGDRLDLARAALRYFDVDPARERLNIDLDTDIPMQAGLAGSTAMLATLVGALAAWRGHAMSRYQLAETTRRVEDRIMGVLCGLQDHHMAVFGGLNFMDFRGKEMLEQRDDEPLATIEPLGALLPDPPLILAHTGVRHHSGTVHRSPRERWLAGETLLVDTFKRLSELAWKGKRALLERDWPRLGALMNENHTLVAALGGSGPQNERLIAAAREAGAWGAKLAGAGGGGTIIALAADIESVGAALTAAGAERLLDPKPVEGLLVTRSRS